MKTKQFTEAYSQDIIINYVSNDIIFNNICSQINNYRTNLNAENLVSKIISRFNYITDVKFSDNTDLVKKLNTIKMDHYQNILKKIETKIGITTNLEIESIGIKTYEKYLNALYTFFILRYSDNLINFFIDEILKNKKQLIKEYKDSTSKKNTAIIALRKYLKSFDNSVIIYNIRKIITDIASRNEDPDALLKDLIDRDTNELTNYVIDEIFFTKNNSYAELGSKFIKRFFNIENLSTEIIFEIEGRLAKIFFNDLKSE